MSFCKICIHTCDKEKGTEEISTVEATQSFLNCCQFEL